MRLSDTKKQISFVIEKELLEQLDDYALKHNMTRATTINAAIRSLIDDEKKSMQIIEEMHFMISDVWRYLNEEDD